MLPLTSVLLFHLLLADTCRGQAPILTSGALGADIVLPCHVDPSAYEADFTLEWTRPDLEPRFVYVWRSGQELVDKTHRSFVGRASLFPDELKNGNISLKLSEVKISDQGTYRCFIPALQMKSFIQLVVASEAVSLPVISLSGVSKDKSGVILNCESAGWYPEPELLWLDGEGNLLPAEPPETLRGPDGLYTVSSRVTVEKNHNNITCRVQQKSINQSRETHIHVPDDFFVFTCSSAVPVIVCLAVCTVLASASGFFVFKWRQRTANARSNKRDETEKGEADSYRDTNQKGQEQEKLMTHEAHEAVPQQASVGGDKTSDHVRNVEDMNEGEASRCQETQKVEITDLHQAKTMTKPEEHKQADQKRSEELKETQEQLDNKTEELSQLKRHVDSLMADIKRLGDEKQQLQLQLEAKGKELTKELKEERSKREQAEKEVEKLKTKLCSS